MMRSLPREMEPASSVLLFGASGHIGAPAADLIAREAPQVKLRLATSREDQIAGLQCKYPAADVVLASYFDLESLIAATDGIDSMFILTPDFIDERHGMTNLVAAVRRGTPRQIVRLTADQPHIHRENQIPAELAAWPNGVAVNHLRARRVLEDSGLPVTFINIAACYMDNFARTMIGPILHRRTLCVPFPRHMNHIDPRDVGAVAAKLLLSTDRFHIGKTYHLDNGVDCLTWAEVAEMMSEVFGEPIAYDPSPEGFRAMCGPMVDQTFGPGATDYLIAFMHFEYVNETIWRRTDILSLFGIKGRTLREWLIEHRSMFRPADTVQR